MKVVIYQPSIFILATWVPCRKQMGWMDGWIKSVNGRGMYLIEPNLIQKNMLQWDESIHIHIHMHATYTYLV